MIERSRVILPLTWRGRYYHTSMDCRNITIAVQTVPSVPLFRRVSVVEMRRLAASRHCEYKPCPLCANNVRLREN